MSVTAKVDLRAFPMEIAEHMLALGNPLNMGAGPVAYLEAEIKLDIWISVLDDYRKMFFSESLGTNPKRSITRFVQLHEHNHNLKANQARQLLDMLGYFPGE